MTYAIVTFGCRVNQADSLSLETALCRRGARPAPAETADVIIVNTCSVTSAADQGARQVIRRLARDNCSARILVTGCYATRRPSDLESLPGVRRVVPNDGKAGLVDIVQHEPGPSHLREPRTRHLAPHTRTAYTLGVQTGCDGRCAFCIVPATRGRSRSVPLNDVLRDVQRVERAGFREVVITGVHLGSYGRDLTPPIALVDLLRALDALPGDLWFRLGSLEPMDCPGALVDLVAHSGRFAPHFHLPLQHASDRMLGLMRRPYTLDAYRRVVDHLRNEMPHASIGADLIAAFPGETDDDFTANEQYLPTSPLTHVHVFPYSDRPGTTASAMPGRVPDAVARARARRLRAIGRDLSRRFHAAQVGSVRPGLTLEDGTLVVTDNYLKVRIPPGQARNERVHVRIEQVDGGVRGRVMLPSCPPSGGPPGASRPSTDAAA